MPVTTVRETENHIGVDLGKYPGINILRLLGDHTEAYPEFSPLHCTFTKYRCSATRTKDTLCLLNGNQDLSGLVLIITSKAAVSPFIEKIRVRSERIKSSDCSRIPGISIKTTFLSLRAALMAFTEDPDLRKKEFCRVRISSFRFTDRSDSSWNSFSLRASPGFDPVYFCASPQ